MFLAAELGGAFPDVQLELGGEEGAAREAGFVGDVGDVAVGILEHLAGLVKAHALEELLGRGVVGAFEGALELAGRKIRNAGEVVDAQRLAEVPLDVRNDVGHADQGRALVALLPAIEARQVGDQQQERALEDDFTALVALIGLRLQRPQQAGYIDQFVGGEVEPLIEVVGLVGARFQIEQRVVAHHPVERPLAAQELLGVVLDVAQLQAAGVLEAMAGVPGDDEDVAFLQGVVLRVRQVIALPPEHDDEFAILVGVHLEGAVVLYEEDVEAEGRVGHVLPKGAEATLFLQLARVDFPGDSDEFRSFHVHGARSVPVVQTHPPNGTTNRASPP
jgi:hypothetical protein